MPVESADDLAGFFDPDEFGEQLTALVGIDVVQFRGIYTEGAIADQPGTRPVIDGYVPRIITQSKTLASLQQGDKITRAGGREYIVNDLQYKNDLLIIFLHDAW